MKQFISTNPFTEQQLATWDFISEADLQTALELAVTAQKTWSQTSQREKSALFLHLASLIREEADMLASLATIEMGKLLGEAKAEVLKCITICEYCATHAANILAPIHSELDNGKKVTQVFEPMGVVLGIFPWNFPYWQVLRSAIPILAGGNVIVVKPAPNVPQCALALQKLIERAGFPSGVFQTIFANEDQVAGLIADPRIAGCTLTGSGTAGSIVGSEAAKVIKRSVLELGGSDPFIVCEDADLELTATKALNARFQNNGQSCIAAKRFIVNKNISQSFIDLLQKGVAGLKPGDPMLEATTIGPLARKDLKENLDRQVKETLSQGARLLYQCPHPETGGFFYPPAIIGDIPPSSPAYREELFGPVISIFIAEDDEDAIRIANDSMFGLGATVWSRDPSRAMSIASRLECGQVFINDVLRSSAAFPFGGVKNSGYGREMGEYGLKEFCNPKVITF